MKCKQLLRQMVYGGLVTLLLTGCNGVQTEPIETPTFVPLTSTPIPPTPTSIPPTPTPILPTSAPIPPTATPFVSPYDYDELLDIFYYDSEMPLDIQEEAVSEKDGTQIHSISYASPKGRVPAYLVVPPGDGPFAGIIFLYQLPNEVL